MLYKCCCTMLFLVFLVLPQLIAAQKGNICTGSRTAHKDHKLIGHVMKTLTAPSGSACFDHCKSTTGCYSINYRQNTKTCHLNSVNHLANPESLVPSDGFLYMNIDTRVPSYYCNDEYCSGSNVCVYKRSYDQHECLPCEVAKRRKDMNILHFPKNSISDKVVLEKPEVSRLTAFTIAVWFQIETTTGSSLYSIFQYVVDITGDYSEIGIALKSTDTTIIMNDALHSVTGAPLLTNSYWHHITVTWQSSNGELNVYLNGTKVFTKTVNAGRVIGPGTVLLGQEADSYVGSFDLSQAFHGNMTSVNMWDRVLTAQEITTQSQSCTSGGDGNIVKWTDLKGRGEGQVTLVCSPFCI